MSKIMYREEFPIVRKAPDLREVPIKDRPKVEDGSIAAVLMAVFVGAAILLMVV